MIAIDNEKFEQAYASRSQASGGVTLVTFFHDDKPPEFCSLVAAVIDQLKTELGDWFQPYEMRQVHATIAALEGKLTPSGEVVNHLLRERSQRYECPLAPMRMAELLHFFRVASFPLLVQVGGFSDQTVNPYDLIRKPSDRSFDIQPTGLMVMMGWSAFSQNQPFAPTVLGIRKYLEGFGVVHKYHVSPQAQDNDLFFVIGALNQPKWAAATACEQAECVTALARICQEIRTALSLKPHFFALQRQNFWIVRYLQTNFAQLDFAKPIDEITLEEWLALYNP